MDAAASLNSVDKARKGLCEALQGIKAVGSFAAFTKIPETSIKPILVHGVGHIAHPLQEVTARQLIEKARQAPYGKGSETFVDTSVRNTWELDAAQLDLNPQWGSTIDTACTWVAQQLGITAPVTAELYKMLIYEKGAMFKAHTDTEKIPGMFGTLVICLPSEHQGGDLVVKHRDVTKIFKTSETQPSMACWFSDVTHEVLPVASGIRWVLTYNLAISPQVHHPSAAINTPELDGLRDALRAWLESRGRNDSDNEPDHLYYLLDHTYTKANLSLHSLKGADLNRMQCLKDICDSQNVSLWLGVIEKEQRGGCEDVYDDPYDYRYGGWEEDSDADSEDDSDDEDEDGGGGGGGRGGTDDDDWHSFVDIIDTNVSITRLVTSNGRTLREDMTIAEGELEEKLIQDYEDPFGKAERREEDYPGFTGNEGVSATHWYRMTVAVIVPNDAVDQFLIKGTTKKEAQILLPQYLAKCANSETRESAMKIVRHLAQFAWSDKSLDRYTYYSEPLVFNEEIALHFVATVLEHREYELFCQAMDWFKSKLGTPLFALVKKAAAEDSFDFSQVKDSLAQNLSLLPVADQMQLLTVLGLPSDASYNPQIGKWAADEVVPAAIGVCLGPKVVSASGSAIVNMVREYHDIEYLKTKLIPVIEKQASLTPFALNALMRVICLATEDAFDKAVTLQLCKPLLSSVLDIFCVTNLRTKEAVESSYNAPKTRSWNYWEMDAAQKGPHQHPEMYISPSLLAECLTRCIQLNWDDLARRFSLKIVAKIAQVPPVEFHYLWMPFVRELISALDAANVPSPRRVIKNLRVPSSRHTWISKWEWSRAVQSTIAARAPWHFPAAEKRRRHVEGQVSYLKLSCLCQTERRGSPHTLIVTKKVDTGVQAKKEWTYRFTQAWVEFSKFDQAKLKVLLGEDWEKITSMRHLQLNQVEGAHVQRGPRPRPGHGYRVAGVKRRAESGFKVLFTFLSGAEVIRRLLALAEAKFDQTVAEANSISLAGAAENNESRLAVEGNISNTTAGGAASYAMMPIGEAMKRWVASHPEWVPLVSAPKEQATPADRFLTVEAIEYRVENPFPEGWPGLAASVWAPWNQSQE
ncbi:hypothetical protein B0T21DRAFT_395412 [Apiosordaria backusii]|uniref:Prolyl 4-hydroxylase alpha subunit Fe(2+) 2OG dioxygenase domain-containing protein n=1 Tax=Apiosordaria backusii TaxID=314023 RepID=A0AA40AXX1_9PEZI|nr:hypothetical protein B0T21DRAFT_395412 [Apiosordaria backusii]